MVRYLTQPVNTNICGPVAIINIMKFFGFPATSRSMSFIKFKCDYDNGTTEVGFNQALKSIKPLKFYIRKFPTTQQINKHLEKDGGVILLTYVQDNSSIYSHLWVVSAKNETQYTCHNYRDKSMEFMTKQELQKAIKLKFDEDEVPKAWFVNLRE